MEVVTRSPREPGFKLGRLMNAVIVGEQVNVGPGRHLAVKLLQKTEKFLATMARFASRNHCASEHVERRA